MAQDREITQKQVSNWLLNYAKRVYGATELEDMVKTLTDVVPLSANEYYSINIEQS